MPIRVKVNTSGADALFKKMGWTARNSVPGYLRQEARLVAVSLAFQTQPFGDSATTRAVGRAAVSRDIYRVYATPGKAFADIQNSNAQAGFWKAVKISAWERAKKILTKSGNALKFAAIDNFDGGAQHRQLRNGQGRIPPSQKPVMIVKNPQALKTYVASEQDKVGFGKSGWASCAKALGGSRGIPGWISRLNGPGLVVEDYGADISKVTMINQVPYASEIINESGKQNAIRIANDRLTRSIQAAIRAAARLGRTV